MLYLCISDWLVGGREQVDYGARLVEAAQRLRPDGILLLGRMIRFSRLDETVGNDDFQEIFGEEGWLRLLAGRVQTRLMTDDPAILGSMPLQRLLAPIQVVKNGMLLPEQAGPGDYRPRWVVLGTDEKAARPGLRSWCRRPGLSWLAGKLVSALAEEPVPNWQLLRRGVHEEQRRTDECGSRQKTTGIVHAGAEPYWGQFGRIFAGCPGGPGFLLVLDTERPLACGLVPINPA